MEGDVGGQAVKCRDAAHAERALLQLPKHRVAEDVIHVAGIIGRAASAFEVFRRCHGYQFFGSLHWQRIQQDLVEEGKDRGIRPDPEAYRKDYCKA